MKIKLREQININQKNLKKINELISIKYPNINNGGCGVFAKAFHTITNLPYMLIIDDGLLEDDPPIHVMIQLPDKKLYDGLKLKSEKQIESYYKSDIEGNILFLEDYDGSILKNYYNDLGEGLFSEDFKEEYDNIYNLILNVLKNKGDQYS